MVGLSRTLLAVGLSALAASASAQNLVFNSSFEFPLAGGGVNCFENTTLGGWSSSGPAESCYLSNALPSPYPDAVDGVQYLYLGRNLIGGVTLSQSIALQAGTRYDLTFYLAGLGAHPGGTLLASIGGDVVLTTSTPNSSSNWVFHTVSFTAASTGFSALAFVSPTGGAFNIDQVSLEVAAIPEPATWALWAEGAVLIAGRARKSRRLVPEA